MRSITRHFTYAQVRATQTVIVVLAVIALFTKGVLLYGPIMFFVALGALALYGGWYVAWIYWDGKERTLSRKVKEKFYSE